MAHAAEGGKMKYIDTDREFVSPLCNELVASRAAPNSVMYSTLLGSPADDNEDEDLDLQKYNNC